MINDTLLSSVVEPVTLQEIKQRLGVNQDDTDRDLDILSKAQAARTLLEVEANSIFSTRSITAYAGDFEDRFYLLKPLQSVTSVTYYDVNDVLQTVSPSLYWVDLPLDRIVFKSSFIIPTLSERPNPVVINYVAGYSVTPQQLKEAILITVGQWEIHQNDMQAGSRPMTLPNAAKQLLNGFRDFRAHA